ncbi:LOW QUALITY PROTEIN: spermatogenesis-associated protein 21 [Nycticebus coucang]|uniref:LOW QUALITY PROTEIN: spermatogenesis-associated protein 21 n=1 Tax=Nycticebus coucang TaxID=9470 RepID=UPI00234DC48F|nr:LOW QUALITY PROTEIN: spermatogenesis-associated protein 21 [Nycticebus coucang]
MDNRNTKMQTEGRTKFPGAQSSPSLRITRKMAGVEPTISGVSQVVFPDAAEVGSGKQPLTAPGRPEKGREHREASEEGPPDLRTQEQRPPARRSKKQSSWAPQEGPGERQAGKPESEVELLPSRVTAVPQGLQQPGLGKETEDQQVKQQRNPRTSKGQPPESCQGSEHHSTLDEKAANRSDTIQPTEPCCTLDSRGQPLGDKPSKEAANPHSRPQGALPELSPGEQEESSQEAPPLMPIVTPEKNHFLPSMPGPKIPKEGGEAVETQPAQAALPLSEVRDAGERRELDCMQRQLQEPVVDAGTQNSSSLRQGFMKCLLEVEEAETAHRKTSKARASSSRKSPRILTPVPTAVPLSNSAPCLPLTLSQTPSSSPATAPPWGWPPAPGPVSAPMGAPVPASVPGPVLPVPVLDLGWRRTELLYQSSEKNLSYANARQQPEEHSLLKGYQNWEERPEEHLTLKQEEAFRSYFELFNGSGEVDAQSLKNILLWVGFSLTPEQVKDALMSADVNGDGHVDFKDFLDVMTDTRRFFCSVEQNALMDVALPNPHTLLFEILSLLVEMLALPEAALEEITNYYQKKLKEGTYKAQEMASAIGQLRLRKKLPYNPQQAESSEVPERRVLRILNRLKQHNYAASLQSPYVQVPCPRLDKKPIRRKQGNQYMLEQTAPTGLGPDIGSLFFPSGSQEGREHNSNSRKWLSSVPARTH